MFALPPYSLLAALQPPRVRIQFSEVQLYCSKHFPINLINALRKSNKINLWLTWTNGIFVHMRTHTHTLALGLCLCQLLPFAISIKWKHRKKLYVSLMRCICLYLNAPVYFLNLFIRIGKTIRWWYSMNHHNDYHRTRHLVHWNYSPVCKTDMIWKARDK